MLVVAGLSLTNLHPRVWDPSSPFYLPRLRAVMVSYADFHRMPARRRAAMASGLHAYLGIPQHVKVYLDNGAFYFIQRDGETPPEDYETFVAEARPDWWPIPRDYIPIPSMSRAKQLDCFTRTMAVNCAYPHDGYVPIVHIGELLDEYIAAVLAHDRLAAKPSIGLGGIVPNLLRKPKARPYHDVLTGLHRARRAFREKQLHLFGVGGTATLHLAALLGIDSVDSTGWRNRAARGIVQLLGRGDRMVAKMGSWRGREPDRREWELLAACQCPACQHWGVEGLRARGLQGFCHRATHNLWTLLEEARLIEVHLADGSYTTWYAGHIENSIYRPLIDELLRVLEAPDQLQDQRAR
jgi:7-cyano-7-deazaguanine tRNA-ribosyltransferase